uniref:Protease inhibitor6 n=1 Tax=Samia ricini TaxID=63990 RepID=A0A0M5TLR6_SAMRI|nr:protease inhibitor6 [Samia ricini]
MTVRTSPRAEFGTRLCRAYFPSYGYNPSTKECESFTYGGCGGNSNRFNTKPECEEACDVQRINKKCI